MDVREATVGDRDDVRRVVLAAFAEEPVVADLVEDLRAAGRVVVELVATAGAGVVGHVMLSRGWVDDERRLVEVLVLSPLGVLPAAQGRGAGTALVAAALEAARALGEPYVFLEGDPGYYSRRGFEPAGGRGFSSPSERIPGPACQVAVLRDEGARGRLVYPDAFWARDCVGLRGEQLARVRRALGRT